MSSLPSTKAFHHESPVLKGSGGAETRSSIAVATPGDSPGTKFSERLLILLSTNLLFLTTLSARSVVYNTEMPSPLSKKVTLADLRAVRTSGNKLAMLTCYDFTTARLMQEAGVPLLLVGDSAANVVLGYERTDLVSMEEMIVLGKAVRRGLRTPLMIADMPMGSYEASDELAVLSAQRLIKETGAQTVKLEAGGVSARRAKAIVAAGIPVMGHLGLTPQTATALGGYKAQGKTAQSAIKLYEEALALEAAGCFAIVFEAVPTAVTEAIVEKLEVPVIGIGAGPATAGQVLVFHDLLGITTGRMAKFVKQYADIHNQMVAGMSRYVSEVRTAHFPEPDHVYGIEPSELSEFRHYLDQESLMSAKVWDWEPLP